jgi:hypothetical protein
MCATTKPLSWAQRFDRALTASGLSVGQAAKRMGLKRDLFQDFLAGQWSKDPELILLFAELVDADARWLAKGIQSGGATVALHGFERAAEGKRISEADRLKIRELLEMTWQPGVRSGTCRYCACTEYMACEQGCTWVDGAQSICSACLIVEE